MKNECLGSGGAHKSYFKKVDEIIINLFNEPIEKQQKDLLISDVVMAH